MTTIGLTAAAVILSGCGTVARCYTTHEVHKFKGDGEIRRYDHILIPIFLEGYGYRIFLPDFTPTNNIAREYDLTGMPKMNFPVSIRLFVMLDAPGRDQFPKLPEDIAHAHQVTFTLAEAKTGSVLFQKGGTLADFANSTRLSPNGALADFHFGEINFKKVSRERDFTLKMDYKINGKPFDKAASVFLVCGEP